MLEPASRPFFGVRLMGWFHTPEPGRYIICSNRLWQQGHSADSFLSSLYTWHFLSSSAPFFYSPRTDTQPKWHWPGMETLTHTLWVTTFTSVLQAWPTTIHLMQKVTPYTRFQNLSTGRLIILPSQPMTQMEMRVTIRPRLNIAVIPSQILIRGIDSS